MSSGTKNLPASILHRLRNEARKRNLPFQEILTYYGLERFLYRISKSVYCDRFILKGALVMLTWPSRIVRTTRDIDFSAYIDNDLETILKTLQEICAIEVEPDAIRFDAESIRVEPIAGRAKQPGVRARIIGYIDKVRVHIQIDIGFSDEIKPEPGIVRFPTLLDLPAPEVYAYHPETVLSEKVEAILYLGEINTRMKDFYDIWIISNVFQIEGNLLVESMSATLKNRDTHAETRLPNLFSDGFITEKSELWSTFLSGIGEENEVASDFKTILTRIVAFIQPVLDAITSNGQLDQTWNPSDGWI